MCLSSALSSCKPALSAASSLTISPQTPIHISLRIHIKLLLHRFAAVHFKVAANLLFVIYHFNNGSRINNWVIASHNFKAPLVLSKSSSYENWLKELAIRQKFTDIKEDKMQRAFKICPEFI